MCRCLRQPRQRLSRPQRYRPRPRRLYRCHSPRPQRQLGLFQPSSAVR
ncbi:MAG: hypothetical protein AAFY57_04590 [Cyanobacteria bacterium J06642_2]